MGSDRMSQHFIALLMICFVFDQGLSAPLLSRADEGTTELKLLFDPSLHKQRISITDDYGERPFPLPLPPDSEDPYRPNLEDEYY
ncbi:hypothetical protein PBY51_019306 [Eleginops maclovinus]|uniref:Uncharacterized protein n=2 Tax=Eleginops maclovinus TaxID=56733 RepID=A0AAN7YAT3_ELEMC|nr:hypothetical protein PBY51_019306 [Eleginops maclovinus]